MRKKGLLLVCFISVLSLSSCQVIDNFLSLFRRSPQSEQQHSSEMICENKVGEFYGGITTGETYVGYEFSKQENPYPKASKGIGDINIFAFNDFHGAVLETENEVGLKTLGTFFKEKSSKQNTLILDQGDTWQGSLESNYEYGAIVQDVFNYAGVSLRTVGNHDFDWGLDHLEKTNNRKLGDDYIPVLASNVFDYANGKNGNDQQDKYGKEYATFILDNSIKIGVVGVIGKSQITSISSQLVKDICFKDHVAKAKEISDFLRAEKQCDVVIVSSHEAISKMASTGLDNISPVTHKRYADLVLGGHAHYLQNQTKNGVKYVQWDSNGQSVGLINLKYDFETKRIVDLDTKVNTFYPKYLKTYYPKIEPTIGKMVDDYLLKTKSLGDEVLSTNFSGYFDSNGLGFLMSEAIYNYSKNAGKSVDFAVCNYARTDFNNTTFTYGDLYKAFPFDNEIILMDVSSEYSINSIGYNELYREDVTLIPKAGNTYHIAVIDYLGLHQNEYRQYDKFPDARNFEILKLENQSELPTFRDILKDYLLANPTKEFNGEEYTNSNPHFNIN